MVEAKVAPDRRKGERRRDIESAKRWMGMQRRLADRRRSNLREAGGDKLLAQSR